MNLTHIEQIDFTGHDTYYTVVTEDGNYLCTFDQSHEAILLAEDCGGSVFSWSVLGSYN